MGYESAPAVDLVATSCCVCGRALLDAESLASGIGPICAEKTGYGRASLDPGVRAEVNRLVYELAAYGRDVRAVGRLARLRELGFGDLVVRVEERLAALVEIRTRLFTDAASPRFGQRVYAEFPKLDGEAFAALVADLRRVPGRRRDPARRRRSRGHGCRVGSIRLDDALAFGGRHGSSRIGAGALGPARG